MPSEDKLNGYLYLFFTGGGALLWAQIYLKHAIGATRRAISFLLAVADLLAEMILVYADTQYVSSANGLVVMQPSELRTFITATVAIVGINLLGWFMYHLNDPEHRKSGMAQDLADEVEEDTFKKLNSPQERTAMINSLTPIYGQSIMAQVQQNIYERAGYQQASGTPFTPRNAETYAIPHPIIENMEGVNVIPLESAQKQLWMQSITSKDGTKRRLFCLSCLKENKSWIGGDLCEHFQHIEATAPTATIDQPLRASADQ